ncbi:MAG TPA: ABC transporter permease, partial [Marmoricola sp.]|nr:ABC transporter permease [Marmoricola sp.]
MTGTFTPAPGAASLPKQVGAHALMEARLLLRNGEQLLLSMVIPILALVVGVISSDRLGLEFSHSGVDTFT